MQEIITKDVMDSLALSRLDEATQKEILEAKKALDITSVDSIMTFGADASKQLTDFSKTMLENFKLKDIPEVEELLPKLQSAFNEVDTSSLLPKKKGLFGKIFKNGDVQTFIQKFENIEQIVQGVQKKMQQVHFEILRDIETERLMGQQNLEYIKHLDCRIFAIRLVCKEEAAKISEEEARTNQDDILAMHMLSEHKEQLAMLERQAYNLETQRVQAIQTLPVIKTIIDGNVGLAANLNMAISQSIPTWERNILIALQLHRQQGSLRIERAVHEMTNELIKNNSSLLKQNAVEITKAVESGLIDVETLEEANKNIIETARQVVEIREAASKTRDKNMERLDKIVKDIIKCETMPNITSTNQFKRLEA